MVKLLIRIVASLALSAFALLSTPSSAQTIATAAGPVTVVVEVALVTNTAASEALAALSDMRAMMKRQPGYLSEELLRNLNDNNEPRFIYVSRWASLAYWAALFSTPEFSQLSAHGNTHYSIATSAFVPTE